MEIETQRPRINILEIEAHPFLEGQVVTPADLPETGAAGAHGEAAALPVFIFGDLGGDGGAGAHEGHIAHEDVPQLGQLIERIAAQPAAHGGDARVVLDLEHGAGDFVELFEFSADLLGVGDHGAELDHVEFAAAQGAAPLCKENGAGRGEADGERNAEEQRREDNQANGRAANIQQPLEQERPRGFGGGGEEQDGIAGHFIERGFSNGGV